MNFKLDGIYQPLICAGFDLHLFRNRFWIGHILRRNFLQQRVIEGKIKRRIEVTGRRGKRRRKLLDYLKESRGYTHLKEETVARSMRRADFGRGRNISAADL